MKLSALHESAIIERAGSPALDARKKTVAQRLMALGMPGKKSEHYRHFAVKPLLEKSYAPAQIKQCGYVWNSGHLRIRNGRVSAAPRGIKLSFEKRFDADTDHYDPLYFLGHLLCGRYITVNVESDMDFVLEHRLEGKETLFDYRIVFRVAPGCRVNVYETFSSEQSRDSLMLYGLDVRVGENAELTWIRSQTTGADESAVIGSHRYDILSNARFRLRTFDFGGGSALHLYKNDLADHTDTKVTHLLFAAEKARRGNVVKLRHNGTDGSSEHEARAVLKENATGIFDGLIRVGNEARYTRARQNSRAILLNDRAFMAAKPQLEIYTDELEASHGSTTGQLDEAALFYLRSRGIGTDEAQKMLILAFAEAMIDEVETPTWADEIRAAFEAVYYRNEKEIS